MALAATVLAPGVAAGAVPDGAGPAVLAGPDFRAPWPCGQVRDYYHHASEVSNAIDFNIAGSADLGTPALASAPGTVTSARANGGYGNEVVVDHGGGWSSRVAHLNAFSVAVGQVVTTGQELGKVGSTGNSSGPHLHYEQINGGTRVPIVIDSVALLYDGTTRQHTSRNCGGGQTSNIAVYRGSTATFHIRKLDGSGLLAQIPFGASGDLPAVGRYENSPYDNLAVYRPSDASFYIRPANGGTTIRIPFGNPGDLPAPGHYENSPYDNLAVYRPSDASFYIRPANGGTTIRIPFGQRGDIPAIGRYENTPYDNLAIYRPSDASFYIRPANGGTTIRIPFGASGDLPAPGYYEGLPYTNIAVYRPTTNTFHIRRANNTTQAVVFGDGSLGDRPAPGKFQ
ncbi:M23 family metallopeptidase [Micromonospora sp. WMMD1102]|uniref:M23 family metallopeptidase n=1 Tax=Micromonospora sp. WMMD1102 TaxID=3016105 RepID=UPI002414DB5F|nr:M23 family metallopeptidase [Micromonospora sp. WMMD1102]MDG4789828.1 M23 family metallopeptidase [Micromonospora sp. WMMD1102]